MKLPRVFWYAWIGIGLVFETIAILTRAEGDTLTEVTVATFPGWLIIGFLGWALIHFKERYEREEPHPSSEEQEGER
jgi:hypothetical protein